MEAGSVLTERHPGIIEPSGGDNEIWSFGENNLSILSDLVRLRYRLVPYIKKHMDIASKTGAPVMRPLFFDYPDDKKCYHIGDEYMFGSDILFAPITKQGQVLRKVYLPEGSWILTKDGRVYTGGQEYEVTAKLSEFIAFVRAGSDVLAAFNE